MYKTTVSELLKPLYGIGEREYTGDRCQVCGRSYPLNDHHLVKRSAGELYVNGVKMKKPLITLCGFGNNLKDADGAYYCHGMAHHNMLHFKVEDGELYFYSCSAPKKYEDVLRCDGWRKVPEDWSSFC